jgi:hypothetical protein
MMLNETNAAKRLKANELRAYCIKCSTGTRNQTGNAETETLRERETETETETEREGEVLIVALLTASNFCSRRKNTVRVRV